MKLIGVLFKIFISNTAFSESYEATIAREYFFDGNYIKSISTCERSLQRDPADEVCLGITKKARDQIERQKQAKELAIAEARAEDERQRKVAEAKQQKIAEAREKRQRERREAEEKQRAILQQAEAEDNKRRELVTAKLNSKPCRIAKFKEVICDDARNIQVLELTISHQKRIGEKTGFVNSRVLHESGNGIVLLTDHMNGAINELKTDFGVDFSPSECQLKIRPPFSVTIANQTIFEERKQACEADN